MSTKITRISVFDFDGTLAATPTPELGRIEYRVKTGESWPYGGWWGRKESLDSSVFNIKLIDSVVSAYKKEKSTPDTLVVMLTGRIQKLSGAVEKILNDAGLTFDHYLYNTGSDTLTSKLSSIKSLLDEYTDTEVVNMWEDRLAHVTEFEKFGDTMLSSGRLKEFNVIVVK